MQPRYDAARYAYPGYADREAACGLRIWQRDRASIVMITELADNPGTVVTNRAEALAMQICREFELWPHLTWWIEHYPASGPHPARFAEVTFILDLKRLIRPQWRRIMRKEVESLTGEPVPTTGEPASPLYGPAPEP